MSLVRGFCGELVARVAADAKAVGGVFERGVHEVHAEDDDIAGLKWRGGPFGAEGFYDVVGVVGERALNQVVVCIRCAVGIAEMFEFVRSQAEGERSHVEGDIAQRCPHGIEIVGARAHIYNVAVHSRIAPRSDGTQPFVIEREGGSTQKATEEVHCVFAIDDIEKAGPCFDQAVFEAHGAFSIADDGIFKCRSRGEQVLTVHVIDNFFSRFHDVFAVVEVANDEISVFFHSPFQCFRVCEDVVGFSRREDGFSKYEFFSAHSDFGAVGCLKCRHDVLLMALVGYFHYGQFAYIRFAMSVSSRAILAFAGSSMTLRNSFGSFSRSKSSERAQLR